jgi:RHS repeat-associated protein
LSTQTIAGATTEYAYDDVGNLIKTTLPDGTALNFSYDEVGRLTALTDAAGNRMQNKLDKAGNQVAQEYYDNKGALTFIRHSDFDLYDRATASVTADNRKTLLEFDQNDNPVKVTDALNQSTESQYDAIDRLTRITDTLGGKTQYKYDKVDNLTQVTDPTGQATKYTYDNVGNLLTRDSPDTGRTTYQYDAADNLISQTDARGITASYSYDALNRLTGIAFPSASENISYTYDNTADGNQGIGRRTGYADQSGATSLAYDSLGRLVSDVHTIENQSYLTAYSYDAVGRLTTLTYPSGRTVTYGYNLAGQVIAVSTSKDGVTQALASNIKYLPFGPLQSMIYGNGLELTQSFDQNYRLINKKIASLSELVFTYSPVDNILSLADKQQGNDFQSFGYDALSRLTSAKGSYGLLGYEYDAIGNRLSKTNVGSAEAYSYPGDSHHLQDIVGERNVSYSYDAAGNTLTKNDITFTYNDRGRLARVSNKGSTADYLYNAKGERVIKKVNGVTTHFHYDLAGRLIAESKANGELIREYIYLNGVHFATIDPAEGGGKIYYVHTDHLGTPKILTDSAGQVVWRASYKPFGLVDVVVDKVTFNPRFPGQYYDEESGLYYNYFRYYDPGVGRYVTSDPIGLGGGWNTYIYVGANPLKWVDPFGLYYWLVFLIENTEIIEFICSIVSNVTGEYRKEYTQDVQQIFDNMMDNNKRNYEIDIKSCEKGAEYARCFGNEPNFARCLENANDNLAEANDEAWDWYFKHRDNPYSESFFCPDFPFKWRRNLYPKYGP